jgi:hypothetical protein
MPDRDCPSIDIEFVAVQAKFTLTRKNLRAEGFIDFEAIDLPWAQTGRVQQSSDRRYRPNAHDLRAHTNHGPGYNSR